MNSVRRLLLQRAGAIVAGLAAGLLHPLSSLAAAWNKEAFGAKSAADALKSLGAAKTEASNAVVIEAPQIAENGAVVPIEITSNIPGTTSIAVLIEKNPSPLAGKFEFKEGAVPFVKVNVKIGESSNVHVVAEAGGRFYVTVKEIKVTIGGCGG